MKIALDAMGGDLAPKATVDGAVLAARDFGIEVVLVGDRALLERELAESDAANLPVTIAHASEAVGMDDSPIESALSKPNSSMHVGYEMLKRGEVHGFVSAGNSGAMMATAMLILGNLPGVDRPAIASLLPTSGDPTLLIDAGANTEAKPFNLVEFAVMGSAYIHRVRKIPRPKVGILSNGEEESKGNDLTRAAAATLHAMAPHINYVGYVEGRDINRGNVDVVVTDGFTGNVALKTMEGFASFILGYLREVFATGLRGRLAYLLLRKRLAVMRERFDPGEYGGALLLGVNGVAIIAHGSSNARAIRNAIRAAANEGLVHQVNAEIVETLRRIPMAAAAPAKPAGKGIRRLFAKMRERLHRHPKEGAEQRHPKDAELFRKPSTAPAESGQAESRPEDASVASRRATGPIGAGAPFSPYPNGGTSTNRAARDEHRPDGGAPASSSEETAPDDPPGTVKP